MMFARAMSNGQRWYAPDVFSGNAVYVPEELGAEVDGETGEIVQGKYKVVQERPAAPAPVARTPQDPLRAHAETFLVGENALDSVEEMHDGDNADAEEEWEEWQSAADAYKWAVSVGACANEFEARASMTKVINSDESWGGRLHRGNKEAVYAAFFARQMEKLNVEPGADAEEDAPF